MEAQDRRKRRQCGRELKAQILAECDVPGASAAEVALGHGIDATCGCGQPMQRIGNDVAEKPDCRLGSFTVERHVRRQCVRKCCE